jgi:hypothetical protein
MSTLQFVADAVMARAKAELVLRDTARRESNHVIAIMHGDRADALIGAAIAIPLLILPQKGTASMDQTELEFLQDINALISIALEGDVDTTMTTLRAVANEVRNRIDDLETGTEA